MKTEKGNKQTPFPKENKAMQLILLLGLVSAFGDITYETGRGVSAPFLSFLGASAGMVGLVSGLGEFVGYAFRLVSGYIADRTRMYWLSTFLGYGLLISIPLLAFADHWELAALLLVLERVGKAIRSPARDTILSYATHKTGRGWGFAIHEALDQVGAIIGPLIFSAVFLARNNYRDGFTILWIPAVFTIVTLIIARLKVPEPRRLEEISQNQSIKSSKVTSLPRIFWLYTIFTFLSVAGFANFQIISFHINTKEILSVAQISILYAAAMGVDALGALVIGKCYDKFGLNTLVLIPLATLPLPLLTFAEQIPIIILGIVFWGFVMAIHETIMRASIADLIPIERRGWAYGVFNTIYGGSLFLGSTVLGFLYERNVAEIFLFVFIMEIGAFFVFMMMRNSTHKKLESS